MGRFVPKSVGEKIVCEPAAVKTATATAGKAAVKTATATAGNVIKDGTKNMK